MQEQTKTIIEKVFDTWPSIRDGQVISDISVLDYLLNLLGKKNVGTNKIDIKIIPKKKKIENKKFLII